jgi:hypothetical protein
MGNEEWEMSIVRVEKEQKPRICRLNNTPSFVLGPQQVHWFYVGGFPGYCAAQTTLSVRAYAGFI